MENRFDIYELPDGHAARFEEKYGMRLAARGKRRLFLRLAAAAAALAAVLWAGSGLRQTPESVYTAYLDKVGKMYITIADAAGSDSALWEDTLRQMTDETFPMYDQLPDELSQRQKTRILKEYYGDILEGAEEMTRQIINNKSQI